MMVNGSKYRGTKEFLLVYVKLITAAQHRGTIQYKQVAKILGIDKAGHHMALEVGHILGGVSEVEHAERRPMLSALAVSTKGTPGEGFFKLARDLGKYSGSTPEEEKAFWEKEKESVYETWAID